MEMSAQSSPVTAPMRIVAGRITVWFEVCMVSRAMCGTTSPINPIGPQYAVIMAVNTLEMKSMPFLVRVMFSPMLSAYRLPRSNALSQRHYDDESEKWHFV